MLKSKHLRHNYVFPLTRKLCFYAFECLVVPHPCGSPHNSEGYKNNGIYIKFSD